jgi:adenylate cyclase
MRKAVPDSAFDRALAAEILASEQLRVTVLAITLVALFVGLEVLLFLVGDLAQPFVRRPLSPWLPLRVFGPFVLYECVAALVLRRRRARGAPVVTWLRFANAVVETSLPSVMLWAVSQYTSPGVAFGAWPSMLYFVFIVASTLRLDFTLPLFTGVVAAVGYMSVAVLVLPLSNRAEEAMLTPLFHLAKAGMMVVAGGVAGLVARRLRTKFRHAVEEAAARERVTNLFGQHVSPAVVERLLERPAEVAEETREICVMFLDIRNFTAQARARTPAEVVTFLNGAFAFMIDVVDGHGGFINKFLGDGFMAVFGAPLDDRDAPRHAVAAARAILAEIDGRGLAQGAWPLRVGMGLHAGPAVVGNVGSPRRKEFTAIGDTVNLASRLEQLNKDFGSRLLVSDAVAAALGPGPGGPATLLGDVPVKGYDGPVRVWRLD